MAVAEAEVTQAVADTVADTTNQIVQQPQINGGPEFSDRRFLVPVPYPCCM
jgi:hypothetical protein